MKRDEFEERSEAEREELGLKLYPVERKRDWIDSLVSWVWLIYICAVIALLFVTY